MKKSYNILVAAGAFKDVYSPLEACEVIRDAVTTVLHQRKSVNVRIQPMADAGEYSYDVLTAKNQPAKIDVYDVINPIGEKCKSCYLMLDDDTAFIGSYKILGLPPELDSNKNPMNLTTFGLGQLIKDALNRKIENIIIGLGGTSTVDGGMGIAQALGYTFLDKHGKELTPGNGLYFTGGDMAFIEDVNISNIPNQLELSKITMLCDCSINARQTNEPTRLKISDKYQKDRNRIVMSLEKSLIRYANIIEKILLQKKMRSGNNGALVAQPYIGVAGGIPISFVMLPHVEFELGVYYFAKKLGLETDIRNSDLVITGEGRFDFSVMGKTPIGVSNTAKKYGIPAIIVCGSVKDSLKKYFDSYVAKDLPEIIYDNGVSAILSCHTYFDKAKKNINLNTYKDLMRYYYTHTPEVLIDVFRQYFDMERVV